MNESEKPIDLTKIANPYDFSNPVSRKELFIGRENELKDIKYYLDHARTADRPINLAILGERAAGKTSLLNIIEIEANDRGLVPVRVNLNESDVETHMAFWFKLVDTIFSKVVHEEVHEDSRLSFGGPTGRTYDTYLDLTSAYEIPADKTFCPLLFPVRYAKAMDAGKADIRVSDQVIERDLLTIAQEIRRPIVLLIDECNILSAERALLEMVRNTFMNLPGFMLVFTGTPDLFPLMDEVFSPIVRQFKRIEVTPFADIRETNTAVKKPLKKIGRIDLFDTFPEDFFDSIPPEFTSGIRGQRVFFPDGYLSDLHTLTNGRPYEIQLVCHFMFKRVQSGRDKKMRLSIEVLEDVLRELRQSHDEDDRPIISAVKALDESDLKRLQIILQSRGKEPLEQVYFSHGVFEDFPVEEHRQAHKRFVIKKILGDANGCTAFRGDDFDKIVCKYAAKQRDIDLSFDMTSSKGVIRVSQLRSMNAAVGAGSGADIRIKPLQYQFRDSSLDELQSAWARLDEMSLADFCGRFPDLSAANYRLLIANRDDIKEGLVVFRLHVSGLGLNASSFFVLISPSNKELQSLDLLFEQSVNRASSFGGSLVHQTLRLKGSHLNDCLEAIVESGKQDAIEECVEEHCKRMVHSYLTGENLDEAFENALLISRLSEYGLDRNDKNNVAFILLAKGEVDAAIPLLQSAVAEFNNPDGALAEYNLGLAFFVQKDLEGAIALFDSCLEHHNEKAFENIGALLNAECEDGEVRLHDVIADEDDSKPLDLAEYAQRARRLAEGMKR